MAKKTEVKPSSDSEAHKFKKCQIAGKGFGLVATQNLPAGEKVYREQALEVPIRQINGQITVRTHGEALINLAEKLKKYDSTQPERLNLHVSLPPSQLELEMKRADPELASYIGQVRTNSFIKTTSSGTKILALFPLMSALNHSCRPNAALCNGQLYAVRDIRSGEELEICYNAQWQLQPRAVRRAAMQESYTFECACRRCCDEKDPLDELLLDCKELTPVDTLEETMKQADQVTPGTSQALHTKLVRVLASLPLTHWRAIEARQWLIQSHLKLRKLQDVVKLIEEQLVVFGSEFGSVRLLAVRDPHPLSLIRTLRSIAGSLEGLPEDVRAAMVIIDEQYAET